MVDPETVLNGDSADVVLDASKARLLQTEAPQRTEDRQRKVDFNVHYNGTDPFLDFRSAYAAARRRTTTSTSRRRSR